MNLPPKRHLFFIKCNVPSEEAISFGFRWLVERTEGKKAFLAVPSTRALEGTVLSVLGEPAVRALRIKGRMNFNRIFLRLVTISDTASLRDAKSSTVLALYPNQTLLEVLDSYPEISSILAVPKHFSEIKHWALKWNAVDLETLKPFIQ